MEATSLHMGAKGKRCRYSEFSKMRREFSEKKTTR